MRIPHELCGRCGAAVDRRFRHAALRACQHLGGSGDDRIAAENQARFTGRNPCGVQLLGCRCDLHMTEHGAAFLCEPGHIEHGDTLVFEVGRHAEQAADRHDAGSTHACHQHAIRFG